MSPRARHPKLSDDEYDRLLAAQGGHCALCPAVPRTRRLHNDTNHATGVTRGLLCYRCNRYLHYWMSPSWLRRAAAYVEASTDGDKPVDYLRGRIAQVFDGGHDYRPKWTITDAHMVERALGRR